MPKFPDPEYLNDPITGVIYKTQECHILAISDLPPDSEVIARGTFYLRYAIPTLNPPIRWVMPGLLAGERGGAFTGRKAWDYMQDRWEHHPRADVVGLDPEGAKQTYFLKELDLARKLRVYAYAEASATLPICLLDGIAASDEIELPELVIQHLPNIKRGSD